MKTFTTYMRLLAIWAIAMSVACSKVGFTPTDPDYSPNGTLSKSESFLFNKNDTTAKVDILVIDDNSEKIWMIKVRPRFSWDAGVTASAFLR